MLRTGVKIESVAADGLNAPSDLVFSTPIISGEQTISSGKRIPSFDFAVQIVGFHAGNVNLDNGEVLLCQRVENANFPRKGDIVIVMASDCHPEQQGVNSDMKCVRKFLGRDDLTNAFIASGTGKESDITTTVPSKSIIGKAVYACNLS